MTAIAAAAGVTKPIVYRVFGSKEGLQRALVDRHSTILVERLREVLRAPADWQGRTLAAVSTYLEFIQERPELLRFLEVGGDPVGAESHARVARIEASIADVLARTLARGVDAPAESDAGGAEVGLRPTVWAHGIVGMVRQIGDWWLAAGMAVPREVLAHETSLMITGGLAAALRADD